MKNLFRRSASVAVLKTPRLRLVAMTPPMLLADAARDGTLSAALSAALPIGWPPLEWEPHILEMILAHIAHAPSMQGWHRYVLLPSGVSEGVTLIGCVGAFPKEQGSVEMGYSILPKFQRRGFGTEAACALADWLLQQPDVTAITAQAFAHAPESIKIMQRCGMSFVGAGDEPDTVRYRRNR